LFARGAHRGPVPPRAVSVRRVGKIMRVPEIAVVLALGRVPCVVTATDAAASVSPTASVAVITLQ
jgi:hypothetical protein